METRGTGTICNIAAESALSSIHGQNTAGCASWSPRLGDAFGRIEIEGKGWTVRKGYRLEQRGKLEIDTLIGPTGERIAWVVREGGGEAYIRLYVAGIEERHVSNGAEKRQALAAIAEEHYRLTTSRQERFRVWLNKWVDHPVMKLVGIVAAIVAAVASVLVFVRELPI